MANPKAEHTYREMERVGVPNFVLVMDRSPKGMTLFAQLKGSVAGAASIQRWEAGHGQFFVIWGSVQGASCFTQTAADVQELQDVVLVKVMRFTLEQGGLCSVEKAVDDSVLAAIDERLAQLQPVHPGRTQ